MPWTTVFKTAALDAAIADDTYYVSLHSGDPSTIGANELSGNGYARKGAVSFGAAASAQKANDAGLTFGPATGSNWAEATYFGIWSAIAGTFRGGFALTTPRTVEVGNTATFGVGALVVTSPDPA